MNAPRLQRKDGTPTAYALACGYVLAHRIGDDPQAVTMGTDSAVHWVKSRHHPADASDNRPGGTLWRTFERDASGYRAARREFRRLAREAETLPRIL